jgi:L-ascorbate metabolism protein UlaG (beta-lactamase superfamily)
MLKYLGHSCFVFESGGKSILIDPFISGNPLAQEIDVQSLQPDFILISHGHGDHIGDTVEISKRSNSTVISNFEIVNWFDAQGIAGIAMNHGGTLDLGFCKVKMVNAIHSSTLPDQSHGGNPAGFVLWSDSICFYFAGDTALNWDMKLIPMTCPKLDFAILPIGDVFTMGIEDALIASDFCEVNIVVAAHFDTFPPIRIDHDHAIKIFASRNKKLIIPLVGQEIIWR